MNQELIKLSDFSNAKIGDKVCLVTFVNGIITKVNNTVNCPIIVKFENDKSEGFPINGRRYTHDINPSLFKGHNSVTIIPNKPKLEDKSLVWCWDDNAIAGRQLRFYDAENECIYYTDGTRGGTSYDHIQPYEGEYPEWALDAHSKLEA